MSGAIYYPRLDSLRAVAIGGVFIEHFTYSEAIRGWSPGQIGVRLFFVLSGYLITSILMRYRPDGYSVRGAAAHFYWRRFLRLSPPAFAAIAVAAAVGIGDMRRDWWVHLLYLTNFQVALEQRWPGAGHFWTLAVEEQFYLLWFAVVVILPRRWLLPAVAACLVISPIFRGLLSPATAEYTATLLPGQIDSLATGALLALIRSAPGPSRLDAFLASRWTLAVSWAAVAVMAAPLGWASAFKWAAFPMAINLAAAATVRLALNTPGEDRSPLSWAPIRHVGRISYGLYVYHYLVPHLGYAIAPQLGALDTPAEKAVRVLIWFAATFALAEASWFLMERHALRLKSQGRFWSIGRARPHRAA